MNWADTLGMVIAATSVVITVLAVYVAFLLSRNYLKSIREMEDIRKIAESVNARMKEFSNDSSALLTESAATSHSIFDLVMLLERRMKYREYANDLVFKSIWKNKYVSESEKQQYLERLKMEIEAIHVSMLARQSELYWLVGQKAERDAHLHALVTTRGDMRTAELLWRIRDTRQDTTERDKLLVATSSLRQRLGRPVRLRQKLVESEKWTGRE